MLIIIAGLLLLGLCLWVARLGWCKPATALWIFIPMWLCAAAANLSYGVLNAGYGVMEELPIFMLVFGVPAAVALAIKWKRY
jgi:hypothetical protein